MIGYFTRSLSRRQTYLGLTLIIGLIASAFVIGDIGTGLKKDPTLALSLAGIAFFLINRPPVFYGHRLGAALLVITGMMGPFLLIPGVMTALGWVRPLDTEEIRGSLAQGPHDRPVLLLLGSSLTHHGIDPNRLEAALARAGHPMEVLSLSWGGMSLLMRDYQVRHLLEDAHLHPVLTLMEVARYYDLSPGPVHLFNLVDSIDYRASSTDFRVFGKAIDWLVRYDDRPILDRLGNGVTAFESLLNHYLHPGFIPNHWVHNPNFPRWHAPECASQTIFDRADTSNMIDTVVAAFDDPDPPIPENPWLRRFLAEETDQLRAVGTGEIAYFTPPALTPRLMHYGRFFCATHADRPCILPYDPTLYDQLRTVDSWSDPSHLCAEGRAAYTDWLAQTLLTRFKLP